MGTKVIFLTGTLFLIIFLIGCSSSDSDPGAPALSLPAIPGSLTVETLSASSVTASWQDNSDNEAGFQIEYSPDNSFITFFGQNLDANSSSLVIEGLDPSTEYFFRINAYNEDGDSGYSNISETTTDLLPTNSPEPPVSLELSMISSNQVHAEWEDASDDEENFILQWSADSDFSIPFSAQLPAGSDSLTVTGLLAQTRYYFRVQAVNSFGSSDWSSSRNTFTNMAVSGDFSIENGGLYINTTTVTLNMDITGISQMTFSNDNSNWSTLRPYASTTSWNLASIEGTRTVYARFYDSIGNIYERHDEILLDTIAPTVRSFAINDGAGDTYSSSVTLNNDILGATRMRFRTGGGLWTIWLTFDLTKSYVIPDNEDEVVTVYAEFMDGHGNSSFSQDLIVFDAIRTLEIFPVSLTIDHASDGGEPGEIYWDFYGLNGETDQQFDICSRSRDEYVTMEDGGHLTLLDTTTGITAFHRGIVGNSLYLVFRIHERDSDNDDDYTSILSMPLYESDNWGLNVYTEVTVGELDSGPLGTMRVIIQRVD